MPAQNSRAESVTGSSRSCDGASHSLQTERKEFVTDDARENVDGFGVDAIRTLRYTLTNESGVVFSEPIKRPEQTRSGPLEIESISAEKASAVSLSPLFSPSV